jgi:eukaryotic-like serine/threonine-protein kinase
MLDELEPGDPTQLGSYRLTGVLGSGGMGRVFLGWSAGGRPVAVKVIRAELAANTEFRTRFRREVAAARTVSGLYTALLVDADLDGPVPWLATAYVDGPSLAEAVTNYGALPARSVVALAAGLAEALAAIHAAGLVHRDLKPSNVLLAADGPRVIDFGISRAADTTTLTHTGQSIGSPGYLSPEQAVGHSIGPSTDIFSLGAVLAFAASGIGPFGTGSLPALVYRVVHEPPTLDGVPGELRPLIERCLAKEPGDRPSATELLAEFADIQPGGQWLPEPITAALARSALPAPSPTGPSGGGAEARAFAPTATAAAAAAAPGATTRQPAEGTTRQSQLPLLRRGRVWPVVAAAAVIAVVAVVLTTTRGGPGGARTPNAGGNPSAAAHATTTSAGPLNSPTPTPALTPGTPSPKPTPSHTSFPTQKPALTTPLSFSAQGLTKDSCSVEGTVRSAPSKRGVTLDIINYSAYSVEEIWLSFTGGRVLYSTIPPGREVSQPTYVGHFWLMANRSGQCASIYRVDGPSNLIIS